MAVGYLKSDWDPRLVRTKDEAKEFRFAAYDFDGAGVGFWEGRVFVLFDVEGNPMSPSALVDYFVNMADGDDDCPRFTDLESDEYIMLLRFGAEDEDGIEEADLSSGQLAKVKELYEDVSRYWQSGEFEDEDLF